MKMMLRLTCVLLGFTLLGSCKLVTQVNDPNNAYNAEITYQKLVGEYPFIAVASRAVPESVREIKDLTYVRYGQRALQLDLYVPADRQRRPRGMRPAPAIIFVHGGGWRSGYRINFTPFAIGMAQRGYVAATISYRLSPEARYPAAIHDVKAAVRWLRRHADVYGVDPNRIALAGGSAGGQIAALAGVTSGLEKFDPQARRSTISSDVQAIINIDGLSDFTSEAVRMYEDDLRKNPSAAGAWFGGRYAEQQSRWHEASPINYVNSSTPPILFLISAQPRFSLGHREMIEKMKPLGIPHQVVAIPQTPHSFWLFDPWLQPSVMAVADFLDEHL